MATMSAMATKNFTAPEGFMRRMKSPKPIATKI